jgi:hypothetical protein
MLIRIYEEAAEGSRFSGSGKKIRVRGSDTRCQGSGFRNQEIKKQIRMTEILKNPVCEQTFFRSMPLLLTKALSSLPNR